ncbi:F-box protein At2g02240 [Gossypium hirsutum]|uniref:F-box protein At2g02240 n=1 Tax=Gossypium hirsutum TaxID=3635 RepID=A0ABM3BTI1_GOSHI|nr:F-box protein At2g02240-like [Gossypium hirsutum]
MDNKIFRLSTAESVTAWESLLPCQYQDLVPTLVSFSSKKDIYLSLGGNPVLIEGGRKYFWLEKASGKKCYMLSPKELYIEWVNTPTYWSWVRILEARFERVPKLISVCWFEIRGKISVCMLSPKTHYKAYLVYKVRNVYGFEFYPVKLSVGVVGTEGSKRAAYLEPERDRIPIDLQPTPNDVQFPKARVDGWLEVEMGEFFNEGCMNAGELEMSALEIEGGNWKGGLIFQGIEIRAIA